MLGPVGAYGEQYWVCSACCYGWLQLLQLGVAGMVSYNIWCVGAVGCKFSAESVWHVGVGCVCCGLL